MSDKNGSQRIIILNPDGTSKQLSTDANGNLNVNAVGVQFSAGTAMVIQDGINVNNKLTVDGNGAIPIQAPSKLVTVATYTVTDAYATGVAGPVLINKFGILRFKIREIGGNYGLKFKITAGPSAVAADMDTVTINGVTETTLAASGTVSITINGPHMYVDVQVKNATVGQVATVKIDVTVGASNTNIQLPQDLNTEGSMKVADTGLNWKPNILASGTDGAGTAYTSTASYASAIGGVKVITRPLAGINIHVKEANVNAVTYQIIGYLESSGFARPIVIATGIAVAKNGDDYQPVLMPLAAIDVQVMDTVGGTHGSAVVDVVCS